MSVLCLFGNSFALDKIKEREESYRRSGFVSLPEETTDSEELKVFRHKILCEGTGVEAIGDLMRQVDENPVGRMLIDKIGAELSTTTFLPSPIYIYTNLKTYVEKGFIEGITRDDIDEDVTDFDGYFNASQIEGTPMFEIHILISVVPQEMAVVNLATWKIEVLTVPACCGFFHESGHILQLLECRTNNLWRSDQMLRAAAETYKMPNFGFQYGMNDAEFLNTFTGKLSERLFMISLTNCIRYTYNAPDPDIISAIKASGGSQALTAAELRFYEDLHKKSISSIGS
jgi:hypothetical protein